MSTLHVENLKGLSSGGNANKIIVPSGQTLLAGGHVVQVAQYTSASNVTNSTTSVVQAMITGTFTLKNSNNKVLVTMNCITRAVRSSAAGVRIAMYRGAVADASSVKITSGIEPQIYTTDAGTEQYAINSLHHLDTPSAASTTYSLGFWKHGSSGDVKVMGEFLNTTIILQEIAQ